MSISSGFALRLREYRDGSVGSAFPRPMADSPADLGAYMAAGFRRAADGASGTLLRPHQREIVRATARHASKGGLQSICVAPTGSGKTEVFQQLVAGTCMPCLEPGRVTVPNTVVLVPTQTLVRQTLERFAANHPGLPAGCLSPIHGPAFGPVSVGTYQGFVQSVLDGSVTPEDIDHLVLDEAHRALSDLRRDVFGRFLGNTMVSAYTASPAYDLTKHLFSLLGKENAVADIPIRRMIDEGVLAPIVNYVLRVRVEGELPADDSLRGAVLSRMAAEAACAFFTDARDELPGGPLSDRRFLGYARGIAQAHTAAGIFRSWTGRRAEALSGRDGMDTQTAAIDRLRAGAVDGIFNARLLVEGTDIPQVRLIMNLAPTGSLVNQLQRCGRGIRIDPALAPDDPAQTVAIVDVAFLVEGKPLGRPRFFFEAVGDVGLARLVDAPPARVEDVLAAMNASERSSCAAGDGDGLDDADFPDGSPAGDGQGVGEANPHFVGGFAVRSDVEYVRFFLRSMDDLADRSWLTMTEAADRIGVANTSRALRNVWMPLAEAARSGGDVVDGGRRVRLGMRRNRQGRWLAYIHEEEIDWLAARVGKPLQMPQAGDEWVSMTRAASLTGSNYRTLSPVWAGLVAAAGSGFVEVPEGVIRIAMRRGRTSDTHHIHVDDVPVLARHLGSLPRPAATPTRDGYWFTIQRAASLLGVPHDAVLRSLWNDLATAALAGREHAGRKVRFERRIGPGGRPWCIHLLDAPWLRRELRRYAEMPRRGDGWIGRKSVAASLDVHADNPAFSRAWERMETELRETGGVSLGDRNALARFRRPDAAGGMCVHRDEVASLRPLLAPPGTARAGEEWISFKKLATTLGCSPDGRVFAALADGLTAAAWASDGECVRQGMRVAVRHTNRPMACLHRDSIPAFAALADIPWPPLPEADAEWIGKTEAANRCGTMGTTPAFERVWSSLPRADADGDGPTLVLRRRGGYNMLLVHERHVAAIAGRMGRRPDLPPRSKEWVTHKRADRDKDDFPGAYAMLLTAYAEIERLLLADEPPAVDGFPVRATLVRGGQKAAIVGVHADDLPALMAHLRAKASPPPAKTPEWVVCREAGRELGIGLPARLRQLWAMLGEAATGEEGEADIEGVRVRYAFRSPTCGGVALCLARADLPAFGGLIEDPKAMPFKGDGWLTSTEMARFVGSRGSNQAGTNALLSGLVAEFKAGGEPRLPSGHAVALAWRRTGPKTRAVCFREADADAVRQVLLAHGGGRRAPPGALRALATRPGPRATAPCP